MLFVRTLLLFMVLSVSMGTDVTEDTHDALHIMMKSELFTHVDNGRISL